jgi:precorrin-6Y C5,15-methyltransferase (decarboxylating)
MVLMALHVIGLGVAEHAFLDEAALAALQSAKHVFGSARQLETVRLWLSKDQELHALPKLTDLKIQLDELLTRSENNIALLASGDPLFYGIGKWVSHQFIDQQHKQVNFYPAISSIQVACHRLAWALQDVDVLSLHGRPVEKLLTHLSPNKKLVILTDEQSTPQALAQLCVETGYCESEISVCEALGYPNERVTHFKVLDLLNSKAYEFTFNALHISCLLVQGTSTYLPKFPGIPDHHFITDGLAGKGMLTKREVRLTILSLLQPSDRDCIWDIGAGCGGVSVELGFWTPEAQVYAIEHHPDRLRCLKENRARFGVVSNLNIVEGQAPDILDGLPLPNKVFIGGSNGTLAPILQQVWANLPVNGIVVASAVTEATRLGLYQFYLARIEQQDSVVETIDIAVSRGSELAGELLFQPKLPVRLFKFEKKISSKEKDARGLV